MSRRRDIVYKIRAEVDDVIYIPQLKESILAPGYDTAPIWTKRHTEHGVPMARKGGAHLSRGYIPQLEEPIPAPRHDAAPIRTKRHAEHGVPMARKGGARLSRGYIPQLEEPILAPRYH